MLHNLKNTKRKHREASGRCLRTKNPSEMSFLNVYDYIALPQSVLSLNIMHISEVAVRCGFASTSITQISQIIILIEYHAHQWAWQAVVVEFLSEAWMEITMMITSFAASS